MAEHTGRDERELVAGLVDRHYAELFAYLYRLLYDRERAAALAQETLLRAYEARDRLAGGREQRVWLFRTATRLAGNVPVSPFWRHLRAKLDTPPARISPADAEGPASAP